MRLNLVAQYALLRAGAARIEAESPDGDRSVTLFSSINALRGYGMPGYSAAKAGAARACRRVSRSRWGGAACGSTRSRRARC